MKQHHFTEVEMKRYHLLQEVQNGHLTLAQAASLMGVSYRHAIRLKQRFLQQGVQGLKRRQPAQPPHQKITPQLQTNHPPTATIYLLRLQSAPLPREVSPAPPHRPRLRNAAATAHPSGLASTPTQAQGVSASAKNALRRNAGADGLLPAPVVARSAHHVVVGGND
jgi:hypothetical protein